MPRLRLALAQVDAVVGDVAGNVARVLAAMADAEADGADLVAFPELTITGYPPEDLLLKPAFVAANLDGLEQVARASGDCAVAVGFVDIVGDSVARAVAHASGIGQVAREAAMRGEPRQLRNALAVCAGGAVRSVSHKRRLPNYGVFDEERWFAAGTDPLQLVGIAGVPVGCTICEDLWFEDGPVTELGRGGAGLVVNINASPFSHGRWAERLAVIRARVETAGCPVAYVNQVGGQDELVFDGGSLIVGADGTVLAAAARYREEMLVVDLDLPARDPVTLPVERVSASTRAGPPRPPAPVPEAPGEEAEVYGALVLGTRDYLGKNGFADAVIGLSGGIDSSLVAAVAVDALGPGHVHGLAMPSRYSSEGSVADAKALADALGIDLTVVPIEPAHRVFTETLTPVLGGPPHGLTDENLQSRLRGILLMAVSNERSWIVLTTGNKSELATGYSTLYGDSAGGFAVIKDVPKTLVYRLCRWRNGQDGAPVIPETVLEKAPSAELRPDQRDDQSLPPYEVLDPVLAALVEDDLAVADVVALGYSEDVVARVARLVDLAEYKRRQSPPGVRITAKAFGKDRRMPITNRYRTASGRSGSSRSGSSR